MRHPPTNQSLPVCEVNLATLKVANRSIPALLPLNQKSNVKPHATRESRASTREEYPPLRASRGVTLGQSAGVSLCTKTGKLQTSPELVGTLWKRVKFSGLGLGIFVAPPCHA